MPTGPAQQPRVELLLRCAWCGRVRREGEWIAPEEDLDPDRLTHGICPDCAVRLPAPAAGG